MRVYCDSVILIYLLDNGGAFHRRTEARITALRTAGDRVVISDLTRLECRVKPLRMGDAAALAEFGAFFARPDVEFVSLPSAVYDRATVLRATHNFKLGDALHLAAAIEGGCDRFLTNDTRLNRCTDIPVEVLP